MLGVILTLSPKTLYASLVDDIVIFVAVEVAFAIIIFVWAWAEPYIWVIDLSASDAFTVIDDLKNKNELLVFYINLLKFRIYFSFL